MSVLRFDRVSFGYPRAGGRALERVSLEIVAGEAVGVFGPNGAGKTTLTRLAMALIHPDEGDVIVAGRSTRRIAPEDLAGDVGYLFQHPESQLFARTVADEVRFGPRQLGWPEADVTRRSTEVLDELGLASVADSHPYDLPVPRRRMVALATALVVRPRLLLLDEPTAGLDRESRYVVHRVLRACAADGCAIVSVTHDGVFATEVLERAVVLNRGSVVSDGPLSSALRRATDGLPPPPPSLQVSELLGLRPASLRLASVASALADHVRGLSGV